MNEALVLTWAFLLAFAVLAYVILDGFDLGIGILLPFARDDDDRDIMINSVAPVWDGNETWLILGGGGLFAVFPLAYAIIMPGIYLPALFMLMGLVFRGVAFEFRFKTIRARRYWDWGFIAGSALAAFMQGVILGTIISGIETDGRQFTGGAFSWFSGFSMLTGLSVVIGYALLGAGWLVLKTEGQLQLRMRTLALPALGGTLLAIAAVSAWTPFRHPEVAERWFAWPNIAFLSPVPLLVAGLAALVFYGLTSRRELMPFLASIGLFTLSFIGLGISFFPYVVPESVTIWESAAPSSSLWFMLAGAAVLLPLILAYTAYAYWIFRGKVTKETGYH
jgi:cytochrome d ubiquinol oxidase subunit II